MSLSQEPAFSALKDNFVCGVHDISNEPYAGLSGRHETFGKAINTTNGAGPHNLQLFILSADGTVLQCLPGYWNSSDLLEEMKFAAQLNDVWLNPRLSRDQKTQMYKQMQLGHLQQHSIAMIKRSKMQGFDQKYEAQHRLYNSDAILSPQMITPDMLQPGGKLPQQAFKTTDEIMHERMALRPFLPFSRFDVAAYVDYGRPKYNKHEDERNADGSVNKELAKAAPTMGNQSVMNNDRQQNRMLKRMQRMGRANTAMRPNNFYNQGSAGAYSNGNAYNTVRNYQ